jgi:hypothetical protein
MRRDRQSDFVAAIMPKAVILKDAGYTTNESAAFLKLRRHFTMSI